MRKILPEILGLLSYFIWYCGPYARAYALLCREKSSRNGQPPGQGILLPVIVMLCVVGAYASGNKVFCVWTVFIFGTVGYLFGRAKVPGAPFILGAVLGPMIESNLRRALQISHGSFLPFLTRPVSCIFIVASVLIIVTTVIHQMKAASQSTAEE